MNKLIDTKMIYPIIAVVLVIALFLFYKKQTRQAKVSEFGRYQGYSEAVYDGTKRISDYLTLSNGTRLAYDLILPTKKGVPAREPIELVFNLLSTSYRFHKGSRLRITVAFADADNFETPVINPAPKLHLLRDMNHPSSIQLPIVRSR